VDTGNDAVMLSETLASELGFDVSGLAGGAPTVELASAPPMRLGGLALPTRGVKAVARPGDRVMPGVPAEANLPASVLRDYDVVFDYPAGRLTLARPGVLEHRGVAVPCRVNALTGLFLVDAVVEGDTVQVGVDNGSAGTWVSGALAERWIARRPDRARASGAAGSANFFGFPFEAQGVLMRLPEIAIGPLRADNVAALGILPGVFDWYSTKSAGPVLGFIGGNVLRGFRVEVDYPNRMTYWEAGSPPDSNDLDIVGLTLRPEADGRYMIAAVVRREGVPVVEGALGGDRLVRVDDRDVDGATMGTVAGTLRGEPGATRVLTLERGGERFTVPAKVQSLP
jgi:hypothetical protein